MKCCSKPPRKLLYKKIIILRLVDGEVNPLYETGTTTFENLAEVYKALADKSRLHMLALLSHREMCVCELVQVLSMSQPGVSQHLRKLKQAGLVKERKTAQWVYYSLQDTTPSVINDIVASLPDVSDDLEKLAQDDTLTCRR